MYNNIKYIDGVRERRRRRHRGRCNSFCILLRVMRNNDCPVFFPSGMITINLNNGRGFYDIFFPHLVTNLVSCVENYFFFFFAYSEFACDYTGLFTRAKSRTPISRILRSAKGVKLKTKINRNNQITFNIERFPFKNRLNARRRREKMKQKKKNSVITITYKISSPPPPSRNVNAAVVLSAIIILSLWTPLTPGEKPQILYHRYNIILL